MARPMDGSTEALSHDPRTGLKFVSVRSPLFEPLLSNAAVHLFLQAQQRLHTGTQEQRILVITCDAIYLCTPSAQVTRCIPIAEMDGLVMWKDPEPWAPSLGLQIDSQYDAQLRFSRNEEMMHTATVIQCLFAAARPDEPLATIQANELRLPLHLERPKGFKLQIRAFYPQSKVHESASLVTQKPRQRALTRRATMSLRTGAPTTKEIDNYRGWTEDPVNGLPLVHVPPQFKSGTFAALDECVLYFFSEVEKEGKRGKRLKRLFVIATDCFYLATPQGFVTRSVAIPEIALLIVENAHPSPQSFSARMESSLSIKVPKEYDIKIMGSPSVIGEAVRILRYVFEFLSNSELALREAQPNEDVRAALTLEKPRGFQLNVLMCQSRRALAQQLAQAVKEGKGNDSGAEAVQPAMVRTVPMGVLANSRKVDFVSEGEPVDPRTGLPFVQISEDGFFTRESAVHFHAKVTKHGAKADKPEQREVTVSPDYLYVTRPGGVVTRCINIADISRLVVEPRRPTFTAHEHYLVIGVPLQHDLNISAPPDQIAELVSILNRINTRLTGREITTSQCPDIAEIMPPLRLKKPPGYELQVHLCPCRKAVLRTAATRERQLQITTTPPASVSKETLPEPGLSPRCSKMNSSGRARQSAFQDLLHSLPEPSRPPPVSFPEVVTSGTPHVGQDSEGSAEAAPPAAAPALSDGLKARLPPRVTPHFSFIPTHAESDEECESPRAVAIASNKGQRPAPAKPGMTLFGSRSDRSRSPMPLRFDSCAVSADVASRRARLMALQEDIRKQREELCEAYSALGVLL